MESVDQAPVQPHMFIEAHSVAGEIVVEQVRELVGGTRVGHRHVMEAGGDVLEKPGDGGVGGFGKIEAHDPLV